MPTVWAIQFPWLNCPFFISGEVRLIDRHDEYSLLLLAGGKNARMGAVKAELLYEGKTFLEHMLDKARHLGIRDFYISGYESPFENVRTLPDHFTDRGPLGGLHAGLRAIRTPYCLVLPVDAPKLPPEILEELICRHQNRTDEQVLIWEHGVRQEPLIAIYPAAMADTIEDLIREHSAAVFHALEVWGYRRYRRELQEDLVLNVNTPQAYNRLLGLETEALMEKETIMLRRISGQELINTKDEVALEHHLTIHLHNGKQIQVACTPTHTEELVLGRRYLLGDLMQKEYPPQPEGTLEAVEIQLLFSILESMFENPGDLFQSTGCAHSCALVTDGQLRCAMEDIGRHNALDKVIGYALKHGIPIGQSIVFTSGRISEDYLQKVIKAGFRIVVSRSAVTAGAVALARRENITLLGFMRKNAGNVYHMGEVSLR